jgi:hypothetical protein
MAVIQKEIKLEGSKGKRVELALFDSGATYSCIVSDVAKELGNIEPLPKPIEFITAKNTEKIIAKERISLNFYIGEYGFSDEFMVIEDLSEPVIIGTKTLQAWRIKLDFENDDVIIDPRVTKLRLI